MPRIAAAELAIAGLAAEGARLSVPSDLTEEQAGFWREIVAALPADWFRSDHIPTLTELCRHCAYARQIADELSKMRGCTLTVASAKGEKTRTAFARLLKMAGEESRLIMLLSTKLRLTPQSQSEKRQRASERQAVPSGRKPWEPWVADRDDESSEQH